LSEFLVRVELRNVDAFPAFDEDVVSAAVDGQAGLNADEAIAAVGILVLHHLKPADDALAVKTLLVHQVLLHVVQLLVLEVALDQQLAGEVVIAGKGSVETLAATAIAGV